MVSTDFGRPSVTALLPTLNERDNLGEFLRRLDRVVQATGTSPVDEVAVIDGGSSDGTAELVKNEAISSRPYRLRVINHHAQLGPVDAQLAALDSVRSDFVVFLDGDLQHPVELLPHLTNAASQGADVVLASRYTEGGRNEWEPIRGVMSRVATFLAHTFVPPSRGIRDPLSGYFIARRNLLDGISSNGRTYKLLLYLLAVRRTEKLRIQEIPFVMARRREGASKAMQGPVRFVTAYLRELTICWVSWGRRRRRTPVSKRASGAESPS